MSRLLVTMHYPLDVMAVAAILKALTAAYPDAVIGENGTVWDGPTSTPTDTRGRITTHFADPEEADR